MGWSVRERSKKGALGECEKWSLGEGPGKNLKWLHDEKVSLKVFTILNPKRRAHAAYFKTLSKKSSLPVWGAHFYSLGLCPFVFDRDIDREHCCKQSLRHPMIPERILSAGARKWVTENVFINFYGCGETLALRTVKFAPTRSVLMWRTRCTERSPFAFPGWSVIYICATLSS